MKAFHGVGWWKMNPILILSLSLCLFASEAPGAEPVKIGLLTPPQESSTGLARPYLRGAEMAVAEVNAREGKQGLQLLLVLRGGHYIQSKELNQLREIILEERVHFLMGGVMKETIAPISTLAQQQRVPFLVFPIDFIEAASTGAEPPNLFWISPAPEAYQRAAVRIASQFPGKRFFLLARDSSFARSWARYFWETLKRLTPNAQQVGEIFLPGELEDYNPYIQAIVSSNADVCFSHLGSKGWLRFVKMAKKQGYFKKMVHCELESGNLESMISLRKEAPEGVWGISAFPFWALGGQETQEFVAKYRRKTKSYPCLEALSGYVSIYALMEAMKKAGSLDPEKVMKSLEGLTFQTPVGSLAIRQSDHRALWPIWCGSIRFIPEYPFAVLGELKAFGPDSFLPEQAR